MKAITVIFAAILISIFPAVAQDSQFYYFISNDFGGDNKVLGIRSGDQSNQVVIGTKKYSAGQMWKITPAAKGYSRLTVQSLGDNYSLGVVRDQSGNDKLALLKTADMDGQLWKIESSGMGFNRLVTHWRGAKYSLTCYNDNGRIGKIPGLATTENVTAQSWKIMQSSVPVQ